MKDCVWQNLILPYMAIALARLLLPRQAEDSADWVLRLSVVVQLSRISSVKTFFVWLISKEQLFQKTAKEKAQKNHAVNFTKDSKAWRRIAYLWYKADVYVEPNYRYCLSWLFLRSRNLHAKRSNSEEHLEKSFANVFFLQIKSNKWIILDGNGENNRSRWNVWI